LNSNAGKFTNYKKKALPKHFQKHQV